MFVAGEVSAMAWEKRAIAPPQVVGGRGSLVTIRMQTGGEDDHSSPAPVVGARSTRTGALPVGDDREFG